jgi:hypothetical protein
VHDSSLVRRFQRLSQLAGDRQRLVEGKRSPSDALREASPSTSSIAIACTGPESSMP